MVYQRITDYGTIRALITHPTQYKHAGDDYSPPVEDFQVNEDPRIWYVAASIADDWKPLALFTFLPQNTICYEIHACVLPEAWGWSEWILRGALAWMFENSPALRIVASIPDSNRLAGKLAHDAGMKVYGENRASYMKGGKLRDQILYGISKGDLCQV